MTDGRSAPTSLDTAAIAHDDVSHRPARRPASLAWRSLRRRPAFWSGSSLAACLLVVAALAPLVAPHDPNHQFRETGTTASGDPVGPGSEFPLGTDRQGRDYLSRLIFAGRMSLTIGIGGAAGATILGVLVGAVAGYAGRPRLRVGPLRVSIPVEDMLMRATDVMLAIPTVLLAIALAWVFGPSAVLLVILIAATLWMAPARVVYGQVRAIRQADFVLAAQAAGVGNCRTLVRHILPHVAPLIVVYGSMAVAAAILLEATLSYLGAGVGPPLATWGTMIADHITWYATDPRLVALPAAAIMVAALAFNLMADAMRDAFDPRTWNA